MELWQLQQLQGLPLEVKIKKTQERIKEWYEYFDGNVYVSRSGGKDSDVLGDIVKKMYSHVPQVFVNTGLEYDSVRIHAMEECETILKPDKGFVQVIKEYGYPIVSKEVAQTIYEIQNYDKSSKTYEYRMKKLNGEHVDKEGNKSPYNMEKWKFLIDAPFRISSMCCNVMKKRPAHKYEIKTKKKPYIGTMTEESRLRKSKWIKHGCNVFDSKKQTSQPLSFWTEQDILQYILANKIKIADIYGDIVNTDKDGMQYENSLFDTSMNLTTTGAKRTGCVFCMFGINQDKDRFLKLKEAEPKKYDYVMRGGKFDDQGMWVPDQGLGYKFVIDWLNDHGNLGILY